MSGTSGSVAVSTPDGEYVVLCDDDSSFLRRYTTLGGEPVVTDTDLDGVTPYTPVGLVTRCDSVRAPLPNPEIGPTIQRQTGAGAITIAEGARSVTVVVYAGAVTAAVGGGGAVPLAAGTSLTWSVDQGGGSGERLQDALVFTGVAGSDFLVTSTREA